MTLNDLIKLARSRKIPFDQPLYFCQPKSSVPYRIALLDHFRMEDDDGFLQDKRSQAAVSNVVVLSGAKVPSALSRYAR